MKAYVLRPNPAIALTKESRQETEAGSRVSATGPASCQHLPYFTRFIEPVAIILNRSKAPLRGQSARLGRICQAARGPPRNRHPAHRAEPLLFKYTLLP